MTQELMECLKEEKDSLNENNERESLESSNEESSSKHQGLLPDGWVSVCHESGGVVYLHRNSRVCTWSRPYVVSTSRTIKKHKIPVESVPCLKHWLELSQEKIVSSTRIESQKFSEYLKVRWPSGFPVVEETGAQVMTKERQKRKREVNTDDVLVPNVMSKVIKVNIPSKYIKADCHGKRFPSVWSINANHKPPVSILLEFCQHYLRNEVNYIYKEAEHDKKPYSCTAVIGGFPYGKGIGCSKKSSKQAAAKATLELFLPGIFNKPCSSNQTSDKEFEYFSTISIDDLHSTVYLQQVGLPSPWSILKECYQRIKTIGLDEPELKIELQSSSKDSSVGSDVQAHYTLTCGPDYTVTGVCNGRKDGQQLAAQKMLQLLHPDLHTWDSLLTLYVGKQKQEDKQLPEEVKDIDATQSTQAPEILSNNNKDLLAKLKAEMKALGNDQCINNTN